MKTNRFSILNREQMKGIEPFNYSIRNNQDEDTSILDIQGFIGRDLMMEWLFGEESKNTVENLRKELRAINSSKIIVNINSPGGVLNDGLVIKNMLQSKKAEVITNLYGLSASAATVIHQAGSVRRMPENGAFMLIHRTMFGMMGSFNMNSILPLLEDMETFDNDLISMYVKQSNATDQEIIELMDSGEGYGKWINAQTALEMGFVDELFDPANEDDPMTDHLSPDPDSEDTENLKNNIRRIANTYLSDMELTEEEKKAIKASLSHDPDEDIFRKTEEENKQEERTQNVIASNAKRARELRILKIKTR